MRNLLLFWRLVDSEHTGRMQTAERLCKCNHKVTKELNGNNFCTVFLPTAFPQICWATQNIASITLQNTFTFTRSLCRKGCQSEKRAMDNIYFFIANQINEHLYLGVVLNEAGGNHISAVWLIIAIQDPYIWIWGLRDWPFFSLTGFKFLPLETWIFTF